MNEKTKIEQNICVLLFKMLELYKNNMFLHSRCEATESQYTRDLVLCEIGIRRPKPKLNVFLRKTMKTIVFFKKY